MIREFSGRDRTFMEQAIAEAKAAYDAGDFPAGAVLLVDGIVVGTSRNTASSHGEWSAHAETKLILDNSGPLTLNGSREKRRVELFSSVEPCLMCFGTAVFHRIHRIVYAAPDARTGFTTFDLRPSTHWYSEVWPVIESGLLRESSAALVEEHLTRCGIGATSFTL
jgi:tRNA(adenine34) deaminase